MRAGIAISLQSQIKAGGAPPAPPVSGFDTQTKRLAMASMPFPWPLTPYNTATTSHAERLHLAQTYGY